MSVTRTDKWLIDAYDNPIELCEKLVAHFDNAKAADIYNHLTMHGMYRQPDKNKKKLVKKLKENNVWEIVRTEEQNLRKKWDGPNIPVIILPADTNSRQLKRDHNGKSGLAFFDKLFLFVSVDNAEKEIKALFTHEYNHVLRLNSYAKKEADYVLLDTIILEGLAENAVREHIGSKHTANWTSYYTNRELEKMWNNIVLPNPYIPKYHRRHQDILYGLKLHPKMTGYCVGYYLVKRYMEAKNATSKDMLDIPSEIIAQIR